jgi:acyl-CoA reductase-like NAD-dependent aldehyde dehydrogenase
MTATADRSDVVTIHNPATGAVAGEVRWTAPADVPRIAAGLREAQREWEAHFGAWWARFARLKAEFDPRAMLATGQGIFDSPPLLAES